MAWSPGFYHEFCTFYHDILSRNRMPGTGQVEQPYETRTMDLSCSEKVFCPLDSGTFSPHGMPACAKLMFGRTQHADSQSAPGTASSIPQPRAYPQPRANAPLPPIPNRTGHTPQSHEDKCTRLPIPHDSQACALHTDTPGPLQVCTCQMNLLPAPNADQCARYGEVKRNKKRKYDNGLCSWPL